MTIGGAAVGTVIAIDGINAGPDGASVGGYDFGGGQGQPWG